MLNYVVRRLLMTLPILFGLSILLFVFIHMLPGDPAATILGHRARPELVAALYERLGLDLPLWEQYLNYLGHLLRGDLGTSFVNNRPVLATFFERFPGTVELTVTAMVFAIGAGVPLGRYAARRPNSARDGTVTAVSLLGISIPVFVLGLSLQYVFGVVLQVLPATGRIDQRLAADLPTATGFMLIDTLLAGRLDAFADAARHLILPAITLGSIPFAVVTRITRASVLDVVNEDYVRTAHAKGLAETRIDRRHIMRNAWLPVVTVIGLQVGSLLSGAVITETVFAWTGVGRWVVDAIRAHDYFVIQNSILIFAMIFLLVNLIVDVGYAYLNPRIRYGK